MSQTPPASRHPPKPRLTVRVGITGHRPNKLDGEAAARVARQLPLILSSIEDAAAKILRDNAALFTEEPVAFRLVCGFAEGADQMAVEACPSGWQIEAVLPFPHDEYLKDFSQSANGDGRDVSAAFVESLKKAATVTQLPAPRPHDRAKSYADAGGYLLRQIDVLIAVWDGAPPQPGGTGAIAREAFDGHIPVVWLMTTADLPPRLITGFDAENNPVAPDADCTDGPLLNALAPVFAAPSPVARRDARGSARDCLERFLDERWRGKFYFSAYDFLWRIAQRRWPRPVIHAAAYEARCREWDEFVAATPEAENLRRRLRDILLPRFIWADTLAVHFSHLYRSAYVSAYLLSAVAVFIALGGLFESGGDPLRAKVALVAIELFVIGVILAMILIGRRWLWHERWLDYRTLAENLRHGRFLSFVSEFGHIRGEPAGAEQREPPWMLWYVRATMREIGLPNAILDGTYQWRLLNATLEHEIEGPHGQLAYHRRNSESLHRIDLMLHRLGVGCFVVTFVILLLFLGGYGLESWLGSPAAAGAGHGSCFENPLLCAKPWVTFLAAGLPALGAALAGIRVQGDFEGSRERSQTMIAALAKLARDYRTAESRRIDLDETAEMLIETAETMSEDLDAWQELYGRKRLTLPA
jgi:hypothetical protein